MAMDDARLVARARAGDAAAFAALLARHRARLVRACASVLADDAAAADAAQDASVVAWLQLDRLREPGRFRPWLIGIGRNLALGAARAGRAAAPARRSPRCRPASVTPWSCFTSPSFPAAQCRSG